MNGKIFLDRKILNWEWYGDLKTCRLFIHILIKANWKDNNWRGIVIKRGSFITSVSHLSEETSMTAGEIRTALDHLEKTGEIRRKTTNRHTHITVVNYDKYQIGVQPDVRKSTNQTQESRYSNHFEKLWKIYPRKEDKSLAYKAYMARLNDGFSEDELFQATMLYAEECKKENRDKKYIKLGKSFFSVNTPFVDYVKKNEVVDIPNVEVRDKEETDNDIEKMTNEEWMNMSDEEFGKMYYGN